MGRDSAEAYGWLVRIFPNIVLALLFLGVLWLRFPTGVHEVGDLLWAEDGQIFVSQALSVGGWHALLTPYATYLHTYQRLAAWLALPFGLRHAPYILMGAWVLSVGILLHVVHTRLRRLGAEIWVALLGVLFILAIPVSENWFALCNSQYFLGSALALMLCCDEFEHASIFKYVSVAILALTGPFVVLVLPAVALRFLMQPKFRRSYGLLALLLVCSSLQLWLIVHRVGGNGLGEGVINPHLTVWLSALGKMLIFDVPQWALILPILFWGLIFFGVSQGAKEDSGLAKWIPLLCILTCAVVFYLGGLSRMKQDPSSISPVGAGARYFYAPYALGLFFILAAFAKQPRVIIAIGVIWLTICAVQFQPTNRLAIHYGSELNSAVSTNDACIKINPEGWCVLLPPGRTWGDLK